VVTADPLPAVLIHENRLVQLFQNLIGNALKYKNNGTPRIHVSAAERDGWSVFSVADNGIGVDPKFAEHIFGLFKRLHGRREYPGSGIGLAICQRIVEQYGGRIWLETSAPDKGATFCFTLRSSGR
jgi:light-regulated signal transduction histidine kinase (bacteriophytochrome)